LSRNSPLLKRAETVRVLLFAELKKVKDAAFIGKSHGTMGCALKLGYQATRRGKKRKHYR
jgi:hypothetical protein